MAVSSGYGGSSSIREVSRTLLCYCIVILCVVLLNATPAAAVPGKASTDRVVLTLPVPTGAYPVGEAGMHLVDPTRADPWRPDQHRELMIRLWYPAEESNGAVAAWMPPDADQEENVYLAEHGVPPNTWTLGSSHSHENAPASGAGGPFPLLLYSPGMDDDAGWNVAQAEDLASHGYIVAEINHTHEAFSVPFPDGRTEHTMVPLDTPPQVMTDDLLPARVADARFVLDQLTTTPEGLSPAAPEGLLNSVDGSKVGMFGHSLGGSTTAEAMREDPRIRAGVNLDGPILGPVVQSGLAQPLLMLASEVNPVKARIGWEPQWPNNSGLKIPVQVTATEHMSFNDQQVILPQLVEASLLPAAAAEESIGTIAPTRSLALQRAYLRAYFEAAFANEDIPQALGQLEYRDAITPP